MAASKQYSGQFLALLRGKTADSATMAILLAELEKEATNNQKAKDFLNYIKDEYQCSISNQFPTNPVKIETEFEIEASFYNHGDLENYFFKENNRISPLSGDETTGILKAEQEFYDVICQEIREFFIKDLLDRGITVPNGLVARRLTASRSTLPLLELSSSSSLELTPAQQSELDAIENKYALIEESFYVIIDDIRCHKVSISDKNFELAQLWSDAITLHAEIEVLLEAIPEHKELKNLQDSIDKLQIEMRLDMQEVQPQQDLSSPMSFGQPAAMSDDDLISRIEYSAYYDTEPPELEFLKISPPAHSLSPKSESYSVSFFTPPLSRQLQTNAPRTLEYLEDRIKELRILLIHSAFEKNPPLGELYYVETRQNQIIITENLRDNSSAKRDLNRLKDALTRQFPGIGFIEEQAWARNHEGKYLPANKVTLSFPTPNLTYQPSFYHHDPKRLVNAPSPGITSDQCNKGKEMTYTSLTSKLP